MARIYTKDQPADVKPLTPEEMGGEPNPEKIGRMFAGHDSDAKGMENAPEPSPFADNGDTGAEGAPAVSGAPAPAEPMKPAPSKAAKK